MPLRYLFVDMNSYFASVEQEARPELRGRPVAVVPMLADTTCCIAASYEAKRFGIKTGTMVREARRLCRGLRIVEARPHLYITMHHRIVQAVESCLHVDSVMSIDEMACRLPTDVQEVSHALELGRQVKATIARDVGSQLRCSVGLGPNVLLAKVAADMQKPDGLTAIRPEELPGRLFELELNDFPGIGPRMERRLHAAGITTVEQLCQLSCEQLTTIWGSEIIAERWWQRLRGNDVREPPTRRSSFGHSRVLAPELRNDASAEAVVIGLLHKTAARMRSENYWCGSLTLSIKYIHAPSWHVCERLTPCRDTLTLLRFLGRLWAGKPRGTPLKVGVVLGHLQASHNLAPPLFAEDRRLLALADVMDELTARFGEGAIYFAGMHPTEARPPIRIAFTRIPEI